MSAGMKKPSCKGPGFGYMGHFAKPGNVERGHNDVAGDPLAGMLAKVMPQAMAGGLRGTQARKPRFTHVDRANAGKAGRPPKKLGNF